MAYHRDHNYNARNYKKYGYDVFQNRKLCVALCGDLLAHYEQERYILQMLFQAGFGETLAEIPFTTEQKLKIGIARVNTFLQKQAIAQDVRICIIEIVQKAFASDNILIKNISIQPIITKSYNELHFRLMLPEMHEFSNRLEFITTFQYRDLSPNIDTIFEKAIYTDSLNLSHESYMNYCLLPRRKSRNLKVTIPSNGDKILLSGSTIDFTFLSSNYNKIVISYQINIDHKLKLNQISITKMTSAEYEKTLEIINTLFKYG